MSINLSISTRLSDARAIDSISQYRIFLSSYENVSMKVNNLMVKLRGLLLSLKLRRFTHLLLITRNVTRWSSTFEMLLRYNRIREFSPSLYSVEIDSMSLSSPENRRMDDLMVDLKDFESVSKALQREATRLSDVRAIFDAIIDDYSNTGHRISPTVDIVHCPGFSLQL